MDPSRTGYFETTPTTMPILSRLDVIERQGPKGQTIVPPATEDLVPSELKYRLSPGDVLRVEIFELVTPGQAEREELAVDQTGNARIKEIGDVAAAGLTIEEFQMEVSAKVGRLIANPVVQVSLLKGQGFQFAITGAVNQTGVYTLERPDFRLSEAIALAGGTLPTTQRVKVIRAAPLDDSLRPVYPKRQATGQDATGGAQTAPTTTVPTKPEAGNSGSDIDQLINQLGNDTKASASNPAETKPADAKAAETRAAEPKPADAPKSSPGMIGDVAHAQDAKPVAATATTEAKPASDYYFDENLGRWQRGTPPAPGAARPGRPALPVPSSVYATRIIEVDFQALIKGDPNLDVVIRPGDRVYVEPPDTGLLYIDGEINRIGVYNLENSNGRLTLSRFVSAAGGLSPTAIPNRVDLVRVVGKDREATIRVDLAAIRNRAEPDIYMQADDHVIIGTNFYATPLAVIRNGFRMTYGFGFLLDRNFGNDVFGPAPEYIPTN